jgi:hypothetical protein
VSGTTSGAITLASGKMISGYGSVKGNFTVGSGGKLSPGTNGVGTLTFSSSLTLAAGGTNLFEISKSPLTNDLSKIFGALTNGGTLVVTNLNGTLAPGDSFKLFNAASYTGSFTAVTLPALNNGLAWNKTALATAGVITVVSNTPPRIGGISFNGGSFILSGSNGVSGNSYYVIGSTNLALPLTNWTRLVTNLFDAGGNFGWTNSISAGSRQFFYSLLVP